MQTVKSTCCYCGVGCGVVLRDGKYVTVPYDETLGDLDLLKIRYQNGEVFNSPDFATIRARAHSCLN